MERQAGKEINSYYETVEDAMNKLREASFLLREIQTKISKFKEHAPHPEPQDLKPLKDSGTQTPLSLDA